MDTQKIDQITKYIFLDDNDKKADLAIVFGTRSYMKALQNVIPLYKSKFVPKILFTGGINEHTGINEGQTLRQEAIKAGIPKKNILVEDKSTNTLENVLFSKDIIEKEIGLENIKSITLIVKDYYSRRAVMTIKKHFPKKIIFKISPYQMFDFTSKDWYLSEKGKEKVFEELGKIKTYLAKGDIEEL